MIILIVGTPDSGKSQLAESLAMEQTENAKKYYIATMIPYGEDGKKRVEKHRKMREGKGFITLEWPDNIKKHMDEEAELSDSVVLLECVSNLVGNEMHSKCEEAISDKSVSDKITGAIAALAEKTKKLVVVTNVFPLKDEEYDEDTKRYVSLIARVNKELLKMSNIVYTCENGEWQKYENN